jgi:2-polyprenyl-3-methyl-5-hydroxy-6-metoxy-1,4-benzoquinol methylase
MASYKFRDPGYSGQPARHWLARYATQHAVHRQRSVWSGRVATRDQHGAAGLSGVTAVVSEAADVFLGAQVVDLGSGTGQISLPLAQRGAQVLAVDVSSAMARRLQSEAQRRGALSIDALVLPIEELALPPRERRRRRLQLRTAPPA